MAEKLVFPEGFMLGSSTAAHQVEGNNTKSDYWAMEQMEHTSFAEPSLMACDHYNRYAADIKMMAEAGLSAYRFSIEWARIEPEEGVFDEAEMQHYLDVIECCKEHGLEPVVTLMHFTSPKWLIDKGGWEADSVVADFERYVRYVMGKIAGKVSYVCTINEANMGLQVARIAARYTQQAKAAAAAMQAAAAKAAENADRGEGAALGEGATPGEGAGVDDGNLQMGINLQKMMENQKLQAAENMAVFGTAQPQTFTNPRTAHGDELVCRAHQAAVAVIHEIAPECKAGLTLSLHDLQPEAGGEENAAQEWDEEFVHYLPFIENDDFLGVQNYTRTRVGAEGDLPLPEGALTTQAGYEYYPEALEHVTRKVAEQFKGELVITENGIATDDDELRCKFIDTALAGVAAELADGLPIKGYFYWSTMDNFEWQRGYAMRFGLVSVDRETFKRTPKPSLAHLGAYAEDIQK